MGWAPRPGWLPRCVEAVRLVSAFSDPNEGPGSKRMFCVGIGMVWGLNGWKRGEIWRISRGELRDLQQEGDESGDINIAHSFGAQ